MRKRNELSLREQTLRHRQCGPLKGGTRSGKAAFKLDDILEKSELLRH